MLGCYWFGVCATTITFAAAAGATVKPMIWFAFKAKYKRLPQKNANETFS